MFSPIKKVGVDPKQALLICQNCCCTYRSKPQDLCSPGKDTSTNSLKQAIKVNFCEYSEKKGVIYFTIEILKPKEAAYYQALEDSCSKEPIPIRRREIIYSGADQFDMSCFGSFSKPKRPPVDLGSSCTFIPDKNGIPVKIQCHCCISTDSTPQDPLTNLISQFGCPPPRQSVCQPQNPQKYRSQARVNGCACGGCCESQSNARKAQLRNNSEARRYPIPTFYKCKPRKCCCCRCSSTQQPNSQFSNINDISPLSPYCQGQQIFVNPQCTPSPCIFLQPCYYGPKENMPNFGGPAPDCTNNAQETNDNCNDNNNIRSNEMNQEEEPDEEEENQELDEFLKLCTCHKCTPPDWVRTLTCTNTKKYKKPGPSNSKGLADTEVGGFYKDDVEDNEEENDEKTDNTIKAKPSKSIRTRSSKKIQQDLEPEESCYNTKAKPSKSIRGGSSKKVQEDFKDEESYSDTKAKSLKSIRSKILRKIQQDLETVKEEREPIFERDVELPIQSNATILKDLERQKSLIASEIKTPSNVSILKSSSRPIKAVPEIEDSANSAIVKPGQNTVGSVVEAPSRPSIVKQLQRSRSRNLSFPSTRQKQIADKLKKSWANSVPEQGVDGQKSYHINLVLAKAVPSKISKEVTNVSKVPTKPNFQPVQPVQPQAEDFGRLRSKRSSSNPMLSRHY